MIAWMKSWDACVVPDTQDWQGMMTLPRELEVKDGQIWQQPVREIAQYHKNPCHYEHERLMVRQHFPAFADGRWI